MELDNFPLDGLFPEKVTVCRDKDGIDVVIHYIEEDLGKTANLWLEVQTKGCWGPMVSVLTRSSTKNADTQKFVLTGEDLRDVTIRLQTTPQGVEVDEIPEENWDLDNKLDAATQAEQ